jgi:FdhE protein
MTWFDAEVEALRGKAVAVKSRWPMYGDMVDWLVELLEDTVQAERALKALEPNPIGALEMVAPEKGQPLFQPEDIPLDMDSARNLYRTLAKKTENRMGPRTMGLQSLLEGTESEARDLFMSVLRCDSGALESVAKERGLDAGALRLLLRLALRPNLRRLSREATVRADLSAWSYGHCPVCGSLPMLAELGSEKEGRMLYCSLCETKYAYPRLRCPFCENSSQEELSYFYSESEKGIRIDACGRCGRRIKSIDLKHAAGQIVPLIDDLVTSHMEMALRASDRFQQA